ncbi:TatD family hydrolase [Barnesiella sp. WM24]|uniref:TatD family hydrolase n=1 Tax=Barnesiella sp. WM24 TaxID=2558278 RepID=UPI001FD851E0|nr:TatD family hydrolase [Barnesiella sp. WM24]
MIVDTHTHLYLPEFESPSAAVERAIGAGVGHMVFPNVDLSTIEPMLALHKLYPDNTSVAMGLHPTEVGDDWESVLARIESEFDSTCKFVAVGEIGIDLYWDKTYRLQQREVFRRQVNWAADRGLPVIIHCREGLDDVLDVLSSVERLPTGVFHSFGGSVADVERIRSIGDFYFGINGIVTFKNSSLRDVLPAIGIDRLFLETDSPYLAPVPHRGKRNESAFIVHTAAYVANVLCLSQQDVHDITTANASSLFNLEL